MLRAHQPVCRISQVRRSAHHGYDIRFAIRHVHPARVRQARRRLGDAFVALDPPIALQDIRRAIIILVAKLTRSGPRVDPTERLPIWRDDIGGMEEHAALGFVLQWAEILDILTVQVQCAGVL